MGPAKAEEGLFNGSKPPGWAAIMFALYIVFQITQLVIEKTILTPDQVKTLSGPATLEVSRTNQELLRRQNEVLASVDAKLGKLIDIGTQTLARDEVDRERLRDIQSQLNKIDKKKE